MVFRLRVIADRLLATSAIRARAKDRATYALARHGAGAAQSIRDKLADPRRRRSLRELRLALEQLNQAARR